MGEDSDSTGVFQEPIPILLPYSSETCASKMTGADLKIPTKAAEACPKIQEYMYPNLEEATSIPFLHSMCSPLAQRNRRETGNVELELGSLSSKKKVSLQRNII